MPHAFKSPDTYTGNETLVIHVNAFTHTLEGGYLMNPQTNGRIGDQMSPQVLADWLARHVNDKPCLSVLSV